MSASTALFIHLVTSAVAIGVAIALAALLRARPHETAAGAAPYESGVRPSGPAIQNAGASYFMVAAFFVIFDVEAAILFAWAVAAREAGWLGLVEATIFIGVLLAALFYLWADGALRFGPRARS